MPGIWLVDAINKGLSDEQGLSPNSLGDIQN